MDTQGAVAVVTRAGRGIGRSIAEELGREGARVVVNYATSKGPAEEVAALLKENGADAVAIGACAITQRPLRVGRGCPP